MSRAVPVRCFGIEGPLPTADMQPNGRSALPLAGGELWGQRPVQKPRWDGKCSARRAVQMAASPAVGTNRVSSVRIRSFAFASASCRGYTGRGREGRLGDPSPQDGKWLRRPREQGQAPALRALAVGRRRLVRGEPTRLDYEGRWRQTAESPEHLRGYGPLRGCVRRVDSTCTSVWLPFCVNGRSDVSAGHLRPPAVRVHQGAW